MGSFYKMNNDAAKRKKLIIIGGGFGGINVALALPKADLDILLIDKTNHHLFQPLLYQVATAALAESNIATPIREVVRHQTNTSVIMAEVIAIDKEAKIVSLSDASTLPFDYLVVAAGANHSYFGNSQWEEFAPGLKTLADAVKIRENILSSFELAEKCSSENEARKYMRFVVIGAGPTGVEMAGAIAETAWTSMRKNFRKINTKHTEIYLIEGSNVVLPSYPEKLSLQAKKDLEKLGVTVLTNTLVSGINSKGVYMGESFIETENIIWAAGNQASPLLKTLNVPLDRQGRVIVDRDLSLEGYPDIFVIGDAAAFVDDEGKTLPGVAQVAIQEGKFVAKIIAKQIPKGDRKLFTYFDKGSMATVGKAKAVVSIGRFLFSGLFAWLMWSFIHVAYLISFRNRYIVFVQWIFLYFTERRNASVIIHSVDELKKNKD